MNNKSSFILIFIALLFVLLCIIISLLIQSYKENAQQSGISTAVSEDTKINDILEKYKCELSEQDNNTLYLIFPNDLYNENGSSNKEYFEELINALIPFFPDRNFNLIDNEKQITISIIYDYQTKDHLIEYNGISGFYSKTDGKSYVAVDNVKIVNGTKIFKKDQYLEAVYINDEYFSIIADSLGEGVETKNNYVDYFNGTLSIRVAPNNAVKNMIFRDGYKGGEITSGVTMDTSLREIYEKYPNPSFGNVDKGYLGYRSDEFYVYYYDDEISIQTYGYNDNYRFENILEKYINDGDLDDFVSTLTREWKNYDSFRYDKENQSAYILYANRGVEINIVNNNSKGITLYNNYFFTDKTKEYVKKGFITLKNEDDLIDIIESKRRNNTLEL